MRSPQATPTPPAAPASLHWAARDRCGKTPAEHALPPRRWHRLVAGGLAAVLGLTMATGAQAARPSADQPGDAGLTPAPMTLQVPPLRTTQRTLPNGLTVVALPMRGTANVSVQVWYRVGGKDDPVGRSGFAHLFEHLMFKRTKYLEDEAFDRLTEDVGGRNNAFTAEDITAYQDVVPANHLERILWAEAERMAHLQVDQAGFESERNVVIEEYRQRIEAEPYGRLFNAIAPLAHSAHPYRRPVIGSIADLEAATLDDVRRFHATYYRPDNAVLVVAGDFDPDALDRAVDRWFGPLESPAAAVPRVSVEEPAWTRDRTVTLHGPSVPLPAVMVLWQGPRAADADVAALKIASALLSAGDAARLTQALVDRDRIAQEAGLLLDLHHDSGVIAAYAIAAGDIEPPALLPPLLREIDRLANGPLPRAELARIQTQLLTSALRVRQSPEGLGEQIGEAVTRDGNADAVNTDLAKLQAVTAADVQRVLKRYMVGRHKVVLHYQQGPDASGAPTAPAASAPTATDSAS